MRNAVGGRARRGGALTDVQNRPALREEIDRLRDRGLAVGVLDSPERWNPVAAVTISGLAMPAGVEPAAADLRIPVPNLYGFAACATVVLLDEMLYARDGAQMRPVPFCDPLTPALVGRHRPYFAELRTRAPEPYFLCLGAGPVGPARFRHVPLERFVDGLLDYLTAPFALLRAELDTCEHIWRTSGAADWLIRIGHLREGLGDRAGAHRAYAEGFARFPGRPEFRDLVARVAP
jgi:hypothetical protein